MAEKILKTTPRETKGTSHARRNRHNGKIPAIIYGGKEQHSILIDEWEFSKSFKIIHENEVITLKTEMGDKSVLIRDYQYNSVSERIMHIDFLELQKGHAIKTHIPIHLIGIPIGVRQGGGLLESHIHELEIECLPKDLPEYIEVHIEELVSGHAVHVRDIKVPAGIKVLSHGDHVVASITHAKAVVIDEAEAEPAENAAG